MENLFSDHDKNPLHAEIHPVKQLVIRSHLGQFRKTGEPFSYHPLRMAKVAFEIGVHDPVFLKSLLLHDIVEDSQVTLGDIALFYGHEVSHIVDGVTAVDESKNKLEKAAYFRKFRMHTEKDWRVMGVKLLDCIDNLETIHGLSPEKQMKFKKEKAEVFLPIFFTYISLVPEAYRDFFVAKIELMESLLSDSGAVVRGE